MYASISRAARLFPVLPKIVFVFLLAGNAGCDFMSGDDLIDSDTVTTACDEPAVLDKEGRAVLPEGATNAGQPVNVDEDLGSIADLYTDLDTTTDGFYGSLPCDPSIGGTLPDDEPPSQDELDAEAFLADFEHNQGETIVKDLILDPMPAVSQLSEITAGGCLIRASATDKGKVYPCNSPLFLDSKQPFEGRDIIYVHGLATDHNSDKLLHPPSPMGPMHPSNRNWPQDSGEFLNAGGYFRTYAENIWKDHIFEHLGKGWQFTANDSAPVYIPKANRYMLVAWSSNQTMEFAQHALLTQIQLAMASNTNVVTPSSYPVTYVQPFCSNGCMIISHSTGSPVVSSAMALAKVGFFGAGGKQIPKYMAAHISFSGAISGSRLATLTMALAQSISPTAGANVLCPVANWLFGVTSACTTDMSFILSSIMRDLMPMVMQGVWGEWINASPVPTVTFAGGHPIGGFAVTGVLLPGLDDGVVTMNSACGNPNLVFPGITPPSGLTVSGLVKAFDMTENSGKFLRAAKNLVNQKNLSALAAPTYLAGTCTPWLSPTGMIMPVANDLAGTPLDARNRYKNHYSFVQHLGEHSFDGGHTPGAPWPSQVGDPASTLRQYKFFGTNNVEESSAVTDHDIYTIMLDGNGTHLAKPIGTHEIIRGRKIGFKLFKKWRWRWFWKRTYHVLDKWQEKQSSHYAYEFVGRR